MLSLATGSTDQKTRWMGGHAHSNPRNMLSKHAINPGTSQFPKFSCQ